MDRAVIDPTKPFYFSAYVTERGMPDRIEFGAEMICASESVEGLVEACTESAEEYGTRGYVFMAIPVRRVTKKGVQELKLFNGDDKMKRLPLKAAEVPDKGRMLDLLDELRADVESGKTVSLVAIPMQNDRGFTIHHRGELRALEVAGLLLRATLDMAEHLKQ